MARCRDCKLYDIERAKSATGKVMSNRTADCLWQSTEVWPASVSNGFHNYRATPHRMAPNDGTDCKVFTPRET